MRRALIVLAFATTLNAQTADDIINNYIKTIGGKQKIEAIKTLRRTGRFQAGGGFQAAVREENKRPNLVRQEFTFQGLTGITAWNGRTGWKVEPWEGKKDAEALGEEEMKGIVEDADIDGPLINYQQKGNRVEYLGMEPVEGTDAYKLRVTLKSGDVRTYYMDTDYYVPIKMDTQRTVRGEQREYEMSLGDYKEVAGVYFPHFLEQNVKGSQNTQKTTYDKIEVNVDMPDSEFNPPASFGQAAQTAPDASTNKPQAPEQKKQPPQPTPQKPPLTMMFYQQPATPAASAPVRVDSDTISGLGARNIGSAAMSGRIAAVDAVQEGDRLTIYVGAASGGVWKSTNGGTTYKPVFDKQGVQSIGAVSIDPRNPKTVWVGTGEAWTRNSVSIGDGIYKSTDGGETWTNMGLANSERIARILVDPSDSNTVYACVPGKLWSDSTDRGVYKTSDGGKTWSQVLKGSNASTGCSMMSLDRQNPTTLYAGMWDFRRKGWTFRSGGEGPNSPSGSGLFKSSDGGTTWNDISSSSGLPSKPWGRVAVTVAASNPNIVYAFVEAEPPKNALYRSDDGGKTWQPRDRSQNMIWRPFYFANLIVDPKNPEKIYKPDLSLIASNDGGRSFSNIAGGAHGDFHCVWIDPNNTDHLITGDDGGLWYSYDGGNRWWKAENLPVSQFYHVSVDNDMPYHVYGGLQDNSSWVGDSAYPGGITNSRWENMFGGDGFWMFVDPSDPTYIYAESQGGEVGRVNRKTHEIRSLKPLPRYKEGKLRFNWNSPIHVGQSGNVYIGSQFLFRTKDHGQTWDRISPDLTTNDPNKQMQEQSGGVTVDNSAAEMHTTIYAISESPKNADVIWAGTDDGNLQITRDGGKSWTNVAGNISGLPKNAWVSYVDAGRFDEGTAFATFDLHTFGDMKPYAYATSDYGKTWRPLIAADSPVRGYAHVIRQDLVNSDLLFLGTELGLWVSLDGGKQWAQYKGGDLPNVAVRDLAVHPRDNDLVIATHGRGIWIIDDITPLRALTPDTLNQTVAFLATRPNAQRIGSFGGWVNGDAAFVGPNPPNEASIVYYQKKRHIFGDMTIDILDPAGNVISSVPSSKRRGLNRVGWAMRLKAPQTPPAATATFGTNVGPRVLPGTYTVKMTKDKQVYTAPLQIVMDPRATHSMDDRKTQFDLAMKVYNQLGDMTRIVEDINNTRAGLEKRGLTKQATELDELRKKIVATKEGGMITGEERLRENLADLYFGVTFYEGRPTQMQIDRTDALAKELADVAKQFEDWKKKNAKLLK